MWPLAGGVDLNKARGVGCEVSAGLAVPCVWFEVAAGS